MELMSPQSLNESGKACFLAASLTVKTLSDVGCMTLPWKVITQRYDQKLANWPNLSGHWAHGGRCGLEDAFCLHSSVAFFPLTIPVSSVGHAERNYALPLVLFRQLLFLASLPLVAGAHHASLFPMREVFSGIAKTKLVSNLVSREIHLQHGCEISVWEFLLNIRQMHPIAILGDVRHPQLVQLACLLHNVQCQVGAALSHLHKKLIYKHVLS